MSKSPLARIVWVGGVLILPLAGLALVLSGCCPVDTILANQKTRGEREVERDWRRHRESRPLKYHDDFRDLKRHSWQMRQDERDWDDYKREMRSRRAAREEAEEARKATARLKRIKALVKQSEELAGEEESPVDGEEELEDEEGLYDEWGRRKPTPDKE